MKKIYLIIIFSFFTYTNIQSQTFVYNQIRYNITDSTNKYVEVTGTVSISAFYSGDVNWGAGPPTISNAGRDIGIPTASDCQWRTKHERTEQCISEKRFSLCQFEKSVFLCGQTLEPKSKLSKRRPLRIFASGNRS